MKASAVVVTAASEAEVKAILEADVYGKSGVWDVANAQIMPVSNKIWFDCLLVYLLTLEISIFHSNLTVNCDDK